MGLLSRWPGSIRLNVGIMLIGLIALTALLQPFLNQLIIGDEDPLLVGEFDLYLPPSQQHPLGTDRLGRDALALVLMGLRLSLMVGVLAGSSATAIGVTVGCIAGYKGGIFDNILRSTTDTILVIPSFPILIVLAAYVQGLGIPTMALLLAVFSWPQAARIIRSQVMSLKQRAYVEMARMSGLGDFAIIFKEIMPNLLPYIGVSFANSIMTTILAETGMRLLGLGPSRQATLGLVVSWAMGWGVLALGKWNLIFPAILCLVLIFVALNFVNMGLEETYNPRLRRVRRA